jgi:type I restriction-modification system DNA methylase subunit
VKLVSEPDFVANVLLPKIKEAAIHLNYTTLDFHVEKRINGGRADLVIEKAGKGLLVLEAKYKMKVSGIVRDIEPRDPEVIKQAIEYANIGGYPFYGTCNQKRIILFQVRAGIKAYECEIAAFDYEKSPQWAEEILKIALGIVSARAKPIDDSLVESMHEAFADLYWEFHLAFKEKLKDESFKSTLKEWLKDQGLDLNDDNIRKLVEQTTYLQINKLLFYYVVRAIYPSRLNPVKINEDEDVYLTLHRFYDGIKKIDYAPIYQSDLISEVPFTDRAKERFRTLIDTLNEYDFSRMESDFIGSVYEKLIPPIDRKRLGQFYTPPEIVDLIVKLTVKNKDAKILDPACGSGSFLVKAYHYLREINGVPKDMSGPLGDLFHKQLIDQIYGIDINQFPAHLSVINLAVQNPRAKVDKINVVVKDFFDVKPRQETLTGFDSMTAEGEKTLVKIPYSFDVILANPPYIRQELLGEKEKAKIFQTVEAEFKDELFVGRPRKSRAITLDRMSDIYVYFYIHSIRFLKNGGMLGYISSNKWLEVSYGEAFQEFLLKNVAILYIIEFDRAVFQDAEVDTSIVILQKENDFNKLHKNMVKFARIKKYIEQRRLIDLLESIEDYEDDTIRITMMEQKKLKVGKWTIYLRAPPVFKRIMNHPKMNALSQVADIVYGVKTGYNDFFILPKALVKEKELESKYLLPCVPSPKYLNNLIIQSNDICHYFLKCDKHKNELEGTNVLKYILAGEKKEIEVIRGSKKEVRFLPLLETIKNRPIWYSLPDFTIPQALFPKLARGRLVTFLNTIDALGSDAFYFINLDNENKKYAPLIVACMNSKPIQLILELTGRQYTGMLDVKVYELKTIPVLNPQKLNEQEKEHLSNSFFELSKAIDNRIEKEAEYEKNRPSKLSNFGLSEAEAKKGYDEAVISEQVAQRKLDETVYDILELSEKERKQIELGLNQLQELRRSRTKI